MQHLDLQAIHDNLIHRMARPDAEGIIMDIPYPYAKAPQYKLMRTKDWTLRASITPITRGYFKAIQMVDEPIFVLEENQNETIWMSTAPMELESHTPHVAAARGSVLVGGLGMGMYVHNLAAKDDVDEITVVEINPKVIRMFNDTTEHMSGWQGRGKVRIVQADLIEFCERTRVHYDHAYIDIWEHLGSNDAVPIVKACVAGGLRAGGWSWWGQELDFISYMMREHRDLKFVDFRGKLYQDFSKAVGIPPGLTHPDHWVAMAYIAGVQVTAGLPTIVAM